MINVVSIYNTYFLHYSIKFIGSNTFLIKKKLKKKYIYKKNNINI